MTRTWNVILYGEAKGIRVTGEMIYDALLAAVAQGVKSRDISGIIAIKEGR